MKTSIVVSFLFVAVFARAAAAQHENHGTPIADAVGSASVSFQNSCAAAVKADFNTGVALLHSFWFPEALKIFESVLVRDPNCAMAHWGIALSQWGNPFAGLKPAPTVALTKTAIDKALATGSPTPRERGYIQAVAQLATATDPASHAARIGAYETAMEQVSRDNASDTEAKIFYALAANQTATASDKTYAKNLKAAGILEPLFAQMPTHPGLAHYLIHAYDAPALADKGLIAARKYASLAPAVPHALHMPSHTFTRVGSWSESIETNRRSAEAARKNNGPGEELHALDYQAYAYLQIAQDKAAKAVADHAVAIVGGAAGSAAGAAGAGAFAVAAIPARYALERGAWAEAAALTVRPANTPFTEAITHFARAIGAARSGNPAAATVDLTALAALRDRLRAAGDAYWTEQVDLQRRVALAWQTFAQGRRDEGIAQLSSAADAEDATDKSPISPGPLAPARELLGDMLLAAGKPNEALVAFEATMKKEPNRFRGLYGGASAAAATGDTAKARAYYTKLLEVAKDADTDRAEIQTAKRFLGR
jgi:tetratricopeptide (TPR) repeat protein